MKYLSYILLFALLSCKSQYTTVRTIDLRDSTSFEIQIPSRTLAKIVRQQERTIRKEAVEERKTTNVATRQEAKTDRTEIRQSERSQRRDIKAGVQIHQSQTKRVRTVENSLKWIFFILVIISGYLLRGRIKSLVYRIIKR